MGRRAHSGSGRKRRALACALAAGGILALVIAGVPALVIAGIFAPPDPAPAEPDSAPQDVLDTGLEAPPAEYGTSPLLELLESRDGAAVTGCLARSDRAAVLLDCGEFGRAAFTADAPVAASVVPDATVSWSGGEYQLRLPAGSGLTYGLVPDPAGRAVPPQDMQSRPAAVLPEGGALGALLERMDAADLDVPEMPPLPEIVRLEPVVPAPTGVASSETNLDLVNELRQEHGRPPIEFDPRAYDLALARVRDIAEYGYFDHTNPVTGSCPDSMKGSYGFGDGEYAAENLAAGVSSPDEAVRLWMGSQGHRYNLLYTEHRSGAAVCLDHTCAFLGVNTDGFGMGCYTGEQGKAWHARIGDCTDDDFARLDRLQREYAAFPDVIPDPARYERAMQLYEQITEFRC